MYLWSRHAMTLAVISIVMITSLFYKVAIIEPALLETKDNLNKSGLTEEQTRNLQSMISLSKSSEMTEALFFIIAIIGLIIASKKNQEIEKVRSDSNCRIQLLEEAKTERRKLIAAISHDINSYCTPLIIFAELIREFGQTEPDKMNKWLENIKDSSLRIKDMATNMEVIYSVGAGQLSKKEEYRLDRIAETVVSRWQDLARSHEIILAIKGEPVLLELDRVLCDRAIHNLIANAVKYSPESKIVYVSVDMDSASVAVGDQGSGISENAEAQLFEAFSRSESVGHIAGAGLGLFVVNICAQNHNGTIKIRKDSLLEGVLFKTVFELTLKEGTDDNRSLSGG